MNTETIKFDGSQSLLLRGASFLVTGFIGAIVAVALFSFMQLLIEQGDSTLDDKKSHRIVDPIMPPEEIEQIEEIIEPEQAPQETPPDIDVPIDSTDNEVIGLALPSSSSSGIGLELSADVLAPPGASEMLPIIRTNPNYPERAALRGIQGWVLVEFTVGIDGRVVDPRVVAYEPTSIFNSSAIRAIRKWKYKPKLENGEPVAVEGVQFRFKFELADN